MHPLPEIVRWILTTQQLLRLESTGGWLCNRELSMRTTPSLHTVSMVIPQRSPETHMKEGINNWYNVQ